MIQICCDYRTGAGCMAENPAGAERCANCGRSLQFALRAYAPGMQIGPYRVVRRIGQGGFGAVYLVEDSRAPGEQYALKVSFDPDAVLALEREFTLLRALRHDHLPRYIDMFTLHDHGHLVMEFIPGQNLDDVLAARKGPLPEAQVLAYAVQLSQVLADLHGNRPPIIHRDIKPANIRITPDGRIVLVDFGLVKRGGEQTVQSVRGVGTVQYAPFEQFGNGTTDERSDQYSLAATLYHLVTGQEPASVPERISADSDALRPPEQLNPAVSATVSRALMRGLALRAAERWPSISHFSRALLGAPAEPGGPPPQQPSSSLPWQQFPKPSAIPAAPPEERPSGGLPWPGSRQAEPSEQPSGGLPWPGEDRPRD
jgi:eukaryotic-like serine/threonine-protein kinase